MTEQMLGELICEYTLQSTGATASQTARGLCSPGKARAGDSKDRCAECVGNSEGGDKQTGRACRDTETAGHRWQHAADHEGVRAYGERAGGEHDE
jgi:hypothetical protein